MASSANFGSFYHSPGNQYIMYMSVLVLAVSVDATLASRLAMHAPAANVDVNAMQVEFVYRLMNHKKSGYLNSNHTLRINNSLIAFFIVLQIIPK